MKTKWVVGVVVAAHCVAIGSVLLMPGCGRTTKSVKTAETQPPPAVVEKPTPVPMPPTDGETNVVFKAHIQETSAPAKSWPPKTTSYTVAAGDTLSGIAKRHGLTVAEIKAINNMTRDTIKVGQKIVLPGEHTVKHAPVRKPVVAKHKAEPTVGSAAKKETDAAAAGDAEKKTIDAPATPATDLKPAVDDLPKVGTGTGATTTPQSFRTHIVDAGEDLASISRMWEVSADEIKKVNNLTDDGVKPGLKLKIPVQ